MARWQKYELIALDEVGYVPLADIGAEFLFQVIAERAERAALIVTTNLPFSEWTHGVSESAAVQGAAGSDHRPGPHHRDRNRIVSLPADDGKEQKAMS